MLSAGARARGWCSGGSAHALQTAVATLQARGISGRPCGAVHAVPVQSAALWRSGRRTRGHLPPGSHVGATAKRRLSAVAYEQGAWVQGKRREHRVYYYFVGHDGRLFLGEVLRLHALALLHAAVTASSKPARRCVALAHCSPPSPSEPSLASAAARLRCALIFGALTRCRGWAFGALDDTKIKNFTSCIKDAAFLRFFFKQLRVARPADPGHAEHGQDFPWVSPCGTEINYIRADDTPVVYDALEKARGGQDDAGGGGGGGSRSDWHISYGGGSSPAAFDPSRLTMSMRTGRLYYPHALVGHALVASPLVSCSPPPPPPLCGG